MARVLTPEQFRECREGTVFAYGGQWNFSSLMVLAEHVTGDGFWGFWAVDPMWVQAGDSVEAFDRLEEMITAGTSYPAEDAATKFMSYDGDKMNVFFVLEKADIDSLVASFYRDEDPENAKASGEPEELERFRSALQRIRRGEGDPGRIAVKALNPKIDYE